MVSGLTPASRASAPRVRASTTSRYGAYPGPGSTPRWSHRAGDGDGGERPARSGRGAEELRVAGVVVDEPLHPRHRVPGLRGVVGGAHEVVLAGQLDVGLLRRRRDLAVEDVGVRARRGDEVVGGADHQR